MAWVEPDRILLSGGATATVRTGAPGDARGVVALTHASLETTEYLIQTPEEFIASPRRTRGWLRRLAAAEREIALVGEIGGEIVALLDTVTDRRRRLAHATRFGLLVAEGWRGRGLGRAMIARLIAWAESHPGLERVELHVHASNARARRLYSAMGFVEEGVRRKAIKYADGRYVDDILMARFVSPAPGSPDSAPRTVAVA